MPPAKATYGFRIKPARFEDWRSLSREGDKVVHRLGGTEVRTFTPLAAGPESNMCYSTIDFVDCAHLGTFMDAVGRDLEAQTFMDRMFGHTDSPADLHYSALISEIPLDLPAAHGTVMDVWVTKAHAGRFDDAVAFAGEAGPLAADSGAVGLHLYSVDAAGSQSGTLVWTEEYESFEAYGSGLDSIPDRPDMQDLMRRLMAPDAPFVVLQHSVMREIPMH